MLWLHKLWLEARQKAREDHSQEVLRALHGAEMDREIYGEVIGCTHIDEAEYVVYMGAT